MVQMRVNYRLVTFQCEASSLMKQGIWL